MAQAATLTPEEVLRVEFLVPEGVSPTPNVIELVLGEVTISSATGPRSASLFDSGLLLGTDIDSSFTDFVGDLSLEPSNEWKSPASPRSGGTAIEGLGQLVGGASSGAIEFSIATGSLDVDLTQVSVELTEFINCCSGFVAAPAPTVLSVAIEPTLTGNGDYNGDGRVDAADYSVWRDTLNSITDLRADGNSDLVVDVRDYEVWRRTYGSVVEASAGGVATPEPSASLMLGFVSIAVWFRRTAHRRPHTSTRLGPSSSPRLRNSRPGTQVGPFP